MRLCQLFERSEIHTLLNAIAESYLYSYNSGAYKMDRKEWVKFLEKQSTFATFPMELLFTGQRFNQPTELRNPSIDFIEFLKKEVNLEFINSKDRRFNAQYNDNDKTITINIAPFAPYEQESMNKVGEQRVTLMYLVKTFRQVLVHELVHAWQDFRSKGQAFNNKKGKRRIKNAETDYQGYWESPFEIDARFSDAVNRLQKYDLSQITFEYFWDNIKERIVGNRGLPDKQIKHYKQKAGKVYSDLRDKRQQKAASGRFPKETSVKRAVLDMVHNMWQPMHDLIELRNHTPEQSFQALMPHLVKSVVQDLDTDAEFTEMMVKDMESYLRKEFEKEFNSEWGVPLDDWDKKYALQD